MLKKIGALLLALIMVLAVGSVAFADGEVTLTNGEVGGYTSPDVQNVDSKVIILKKEITAYNPSENLIYGPEIEYSYQITAASTGELFNITDETTDHSSNMATTAKAIAGVVTGVEVTGTAEGKINWTNADILEASSAGAENYKNLTIDFSDVVFSQPGVYRYKITETVDAYTTSGVKESTGTTAHTRYLDVYVMRSDSYTDGTKKTDWKIYGYVCFCNAEDITPDGDTPTAGAMKTNGFVSAQSGTTKVPADEYHTYNLTVGKTLNNDDTMNTNKFPFDVAFSNGTTGTATETFQFAVKTTGNATVTHIDNAAGKTVNGTDVDAAALPTVGGVDVVTTDGKDGNPAIANGATVKYIGIPDTVKVTVTETNNVAGTTYTTTAKETVAGGTATDVVFDAASTAALDSTKKQATTDTEDTAVYAQTAAPAADKDVAVQYTNTLAIISPTGVALRVAPYVLILFAGVALLLVSRRRKAVVEE